MSYKTKLIGSLIYFFEFMARWNSVKPVLNNEITFPFPLYTLCVIIFSFL